MIVERRCAIVRDERPCMSVCSADCSKRSVWLSRADVASSSSKIGGFLRIVRAIATRCFSPPLRRTPRSPTIVSYPCGNSVIRSWIWAARAAVSTASSDACTSPYLMLERTSV